MVKQDTDFLELIDQESLEVSYGGNNEFKYGFEEHWNKEDLEFPPQPK